MTPLVFKKQKLPTYSYMKADPTQTGTLRRAFMRQLRQRFIELDKRVYELVVSQNAFGVPVGNNNTNHDALGRFASIGAIGERGDVKDKGSWDRSSETPKWVQSHEALLKGALDNWRASPTTLKLHIKDVLGNASIPGSGSGKETRARAEALLKEVKYHSVPAPTLYRGDSKHPSDHVESTLQGWTSDKKVAQQWAKQYGGTVYSISGAQGLQMSKYGSGVATEKEWIIPTPHSGAVTANADWWGFDEAHDQLDAFKDWIMKQMKDLFYAQEGESWWMEYIAKGWQQGAAKVYNAWQKKSEFLRSSFNQPVSVAKVKLLAGRTFTELEGMSQDMATKLSRELVDGLVQGKSPKEIAAEITKAIDGVSKQRAMTIARTEIVRAHAEGQLDSLEQYGMNNVGVAVEWSVSGIGVTAKKNPSPCKLCAPMAGVVFTTKEARGMIPRHPNCMCSFVPANVGEDSKGQIRSQLGIKKALKKSIRAGTPKKRSNALKGKKGKTLGWAGGTAKIDKNRPASVLNSWRGIVENSTGYNPNRDAKGRFARGSGHTDESFIKSLKEIKTLVGSTGAKLVEDDHGHKYVMKKGSSPEHLRSEFHAEEAYRALGVKVPQSKLYETVSGPVKLSRYLEGAKTLGELSAAKQKELLPELQKHFAAHALLANWDVVGMYKDNIMYHPTKGLYHIDTGGALSFRAQGKSKGAAWNGKADEFHTLRQPSNKQAHDIFGSMTHEQLKRSVQHVVDNYKKVQSAMPASYHQTIENRVNSLLTHANALTKAKTPDPIPLLTIPKTSPTVTSTHALGSTEALVNHFKPLKLKPEHIKKIQDLNPNGLHNSLVQLPLIVTGNKAKMEEIKKMLPEGTIVKGVNHAKLFGKEGKIAPDTILKPQHDIFGKPVKEKFPGESKWPGEPPKGNANQSHQKVTPDDLLGSKSASLSDYPKPVQAWVKGLTATEKSAISDWKINPAHLRSIIENNPPPPPKSSKMAAAICTAVAKAPRVEGVLYRGVRGTYATNLVKQIKDLGVGNEIKFEQPLGMSPNSSLSHSKFSSGQVMIVLNQRTGGSIKPIHGFSSEAEILSQPGTKYRIVKIESGTHEDGYYGAAQTVHVPQSKIALDHYGHKTDMVRHMIHLEEI